MKIERAAPFLLFAAVLVWYGATSVRFHAYGAIGTDPATYVQMAHDLSGGTVRHNFSLLAELYASGLSRDAFITPGYHIVPATGVTIPNFAFGLPLLLALAGQVGNEGAIYWTTPLLGCLSLVVTFGLANLLFRGVPPVRRHWIGALAALVLAASPKQIQLALVPMSDVPTQLFCALAVWFALCAARTSERAWKVTGAQRKFPAELLWVLACGLSLGMAYLMRHSAVILLVPLAVVVRRWGTPGRERLILILAALGIFVLTALPDVLYRSAVMGSPFAIESAESTHLVWLDAPRQLAQIGLALISVTGLGPILLFAPASWWLMARARDRFAATVLVVWVSVFALFHAPLELTGVFENSLRYLLPAYPALAITIAYGVVRCAAGVRQYWQAPAQRWSVPGIVYYAAALLVVAGLGLALRAVPAPERFAGRAYGWMGEPARRTLDAFARQLPEDAVIGVSDQMAGAVTLYADRAIFRPGNFLDPAQEFPQFLERMKLANRPVYLVGDWRCAPTAGASEKLPDWLANYDFEETGSMIPDLPYECSQVLYKLKGE